MATIDTNIMNNPATDKENQSMSKNAGPIVKKDPNKKKASLKDDGDHSGNGNDGSTMMLMMSPYDRRLEEFRLALEASGPDYRLLELGDVNELLNTFTEYVSAGIP